MSRATTDAAAPRGWQRRLVLLLALLAVLHSIVLTLWLAPSGPIRDAVGQRKLSGYVNPYFEQSWGALAPNAQFVDETFRVRAHVEDDRGKDRVTRWVDLTAEQDDSLRHDLDPARVHLMARKLATNINGVMYAFDSSQRKLVQTNYISTPLSTLERKLLAAGNEQAVEVYLTYDEAATRFASMYAEAKFGGQVLEVQYRVGRRTVPDISDRSGPRVSELPFDWFDFGYRRAYDATYESQLAFDDYVRN